MDKPADVFKEFGEITTKLVSLLSPLTTAMLNQIPFKGSWTAGQVGDHLYKSYGVVDVFESNLKNTIRKPDQKVWEIKNTFLDFTIKMESPGHILPQKRPLQKKALIEGLEGRISKFLTYEDQDLNVECMDFIIPEYGAFTRLEWMWFTIFHTHRHIYQLEKIISIINGKSMTFSQPYGFNI